MNKKLFSLLFAVFAIVGFTSCTNDDDEGFTGTNYVYLTADEGLAVMAENQKDTLDVNVRLTNSLTKDLELNFELLDGADEYVQLIKNPVIIATGEKTASFGVKSLNKSLLFEDIYIKIAMVSNSSVVLKDTLKIHLQPSPSIPELTEEQQKLIEGYRETYNLNLLPFLGEISCNTQVKYPGGAYIEQLVTAEEKDFSGTSVITLSENATADKIVLKMVSNPMGLNEYLYKIFRYETIENNVYWFGEYASPYYKVMCDNINLSKDSEETFTSSLDNIVIDPTDNFKVTFVGTKKDAYGDDIAAVPFEYSYSANDRWTKLVEENKSFTIKNGETEETVTAKAMFDQGARLDPSYYLTVTDIAADNWENEPSDWVAPSAVFNPETGTLTFTFAMDHYNAGGYFQVTSTYSLFK